MVQDISRMIQDISATPRKAASRKAAKPRAASCENQAGKRENPAKIKPASCENQADELQKSALEWRNPSRGRTSAENHAGERQQSSRQAASREPQAASCENSAGKREKPAKICPQRSAEIRRDPQIFSIGFARHFWLERVFRVFGSADLCGSLRISAGDPQRSAEIRRAPQRSAEFFNTFC